MKRCLTSSKQLMLNVSDPNGYSVAKEVFDTTMGINSTLVEMGLLSKQDAAISALQAAQEVSGIDLSGVVGKVVGKQEVKPVPIKSNGGKQQFMTITDIGKRLSPKTTPADLNLLLEKAHIQKKNSFGQWCPTAEYVHMAIGVAGEKTYKYSKDGDIECHYAGVRWSKDIIPMIQERLSHGSV